MGARTVAGMTVALVAAAACTHGASHASPPARSASTVPAAAALGTAGAAGAATGALQMCRRALGARTVLNAKLASVQEVRSLQVGPGGYPAPKAFPNAAPTGPAAWCWTGRPSDYVLFAVGSGGTKTRVEGLHGAVFTSPPAAGPAPIP
ncbi:MAG TPA: hypothetical protein VL119_14340 [Acidimicrobiia bacterium]|nr:hypothetical protein [Acidimicrobiia bacterium]